MLKAISKGPDGKTVLLLGLSFGNLDRFRAAPGDTFIRIAGAEIGVQNLDVVIFSGETETALAEILQHVIGSDAVAPKR
jgi:hypothetical protein